MKARISKFLDLTRGNWAVFFSSILLLPSVSISLSTLGYKRTKALLMRFTYVDAPHPRTKVSDFEKAKTIAQLVGIVARYNLFNTSCLRRSLVTWYLLERRSITSRLVIGVNKHDGEFCAHAWLTVNGITLAENDDSISMYKIIDEIPS